MRKLCAVGVFLCLLLSVTTLAQARQWVSEARLGVLAHDVSVVSFNRERGADLNAEVLFVSPTWLAALGAPRPHLGGSLNLSGDTSLAYLGLTWGLPLARGFFAEGMLGGAWHDGRLDSDDSTRKSLGTRALFRLGLGLGYAFNERISAVIVFDHVSNANLSSNNEGMDMVGLKLGYRF